MLEDLFSPPGTYFGYLVDLNRTQKYLQKHFSWYLNS